MLQSQMLKSLKPILSDLAGKDIKGRPIIAQIGRSNELRTSNSKEGDTCDTGMSPAILTYWFNRQDIVCDRRERVKLSTIDLKFHGIELPEKEDGSFDGDRYVIQRYREWRAFMTIQAGRCQGVDLLQRIHFGIDCENPSFRLPLSMSKLSLSGISDISQISTGEEWENHAQAVMTVNYSHSVVINPPCRPQIKCVTAKLLDRHKQEAENVRC